MVDKLRFITPFQVLMLDEIYESNSEVLKCIQNLESIVNQIKLAKSKSYKLYSIAELTGIIEIDNIAKDIFFGFNSFDEAYQYIELGQISFINDRLGFKVQENNAISLELYNKLTKLKDELQLAELKLTVDNYENTKFGEINEFIIYWLPKMEHNKYNYVIKIICYEKYRNMF